MDNKSNKTLIILMSICVCLSLITLGIVVYDRFIRKEPERAVLKPIEVMPDIFEDEDEDFFEEDNISMLEESN